MGKTLKVGIIGANWSLHVHGSAWRRQQGVEVAAICTAHQETAEAAAHQFGIPKAYWNHEEMAADPEIDIIDVGSRPAFRFPMVMAALKHGKHVYNCLPFALDTSQAEAMRDAQLAAGTVGVVDAQFRWTPEAQTMKRMVDEGFIGRPLGFNIQLMLPLFEHEGKPYPFCAYAGVGSPYFWLADKRNGGSAWRNFASHSLLFLTHLLGSLEEATALLTRGVPEWFLPTGDVLKPDTHDLGSATLRLANGAVGNLQVGWCTPDTEGFRIEVWGDKGRLLLTDAAFGNAPGAKLYAGDALPQTLGQRSTRAVDIEQGYYAVPGVQADVAGLRPFVAMDWIFADMLSAIRNGREGSPSFSEAATVHRIVEDLERASEERRWIRLQH